MWLETLTNLIMARMDSKLEIGRRTRLHAIVFGRYTKKIQ